MNFLPIELIKLICSFMQPLDCCKLGLTNKFYFDNLIKNNNDMFFHGAVHAIERFSKADDGCPKVTIKCRNKKIVHKITFQSGTHSSARYYNITHPNDNYYKTKLKLDEVLFPATPYKTIDITYKNMSMRSKTTTHKAFNTLKSALLCKLPGIKKRITKKIVLTTVENV